MATQVQPRRGDNTTVTGRTLTSGEFDYNTTKKRLHQHDGSTAGGTPYPNIADIQKDAVSYAAASGTNAVTATLDPPLPALVAGMRIKLKHANTNTGAMTIDAGGGAVNCRMADPGSGTLIALVGGECVQNGIYEWHYDGTYWQLGNSGGAGGVSINQSDLDTLTGSVSYSPGGNALTSSDFTLPGGSYGFYPQLQIRCGSSNGSVTMEAHLGQKTFATPNTDSGYETRIRLGFTAHAGDGTNAAIIYAQQRYIAACPPYDLGDGEVAGFVFAKIDVDGRVIASYVADEPPWANNGPTSIRADRIDPLTGQKYRRVAKRPSFQDIMDGAPITYADEAITQKVKNADMKLIPHPFGDVAPGETVVILDPMDERVRRLMRFQNTGGDIGEFLSRVKVDNESLKRKTPRGVRAVGFKF